MPQYPAVIELGSLTGADGFQINGEAADQRSGTAVASAGDVNGDGYEDVIIAARNVPDGARYVVFGKAGGFAAELSLSALDGTNGFQIIGAAPNDFRGNHSVASAGDVNGDGYGDLIFGASETLVNGEMIGASYVVFGQAGPFASSFNVSRLNGTNGFRITGEPSGGWSGFSVASAGDVNGDGYDDLIIGAPKADLAGTDSGTGYVVFGKASGFAADLSLSTLNGANGFVIDGETENDQAGFAVSSAGDVNNDGFDDLIIGAPSFAFNDVGLAYVVFGKATAFAASVNLAALDGTNGFQLSGAASGDHDGFAVASAGDLNADGFGDLVIGAWRADPTGGDSGASYVVFGKAGGFAAEINLSTLNGTTGFRIVQGSTNAQSGRSVASAGDVNGDGFGDLLIGTGGIGSYVLFGKPGNFTADINLSSLDGSNGFKINSEVPGDGAGRSVSAAEINGDGLTDLIVGALDGATDDRGTTYVIFGRAPDAAVNRTGTVASQTLVGSTFADTLSGLAGDDRLFGGAGNDLLDGGDGSDVAVFAALLAASAAGRVGDSGGVRVTGPLGTDTLAGVETLRFADGAVAVASLGAYQFAGTIQLSALNGADGFRLTGGAAGDRAGGSVASAGDVNGDGYGDFIVGASGADASYVVFGGVGGFPATFALSSLNGSNGFRINGEFLYDGAVVASAGDVNGDGFDDVFIGSSNYASAYGNPSPRSYVVFGKAGGFGASLNLSTLNGADGFQINGAPYDYGGSAGASAGDVNGDGFDDLIVGEFGADENGDNSGGAYVIFGKAGGFTAQLNLSGLNGANGFRLNGVAANDNTGLSVASAGDVNGDGYDDVIVGAVGADVGAVESGAAYVVFGKAGGFAAQTNLSTLNGSNGFRLAGAAGNFAGGSVASAGDVNGDGFDDLIVGATGVDANGNNSGASYVVFGKAGGFAASISLATLNGITGFRISGAAEGDVSGGSVASAGDVNGDGFDDLIVGAPLADPNGLGSGSSYVIFGKASGFAADLNVATLNGATGFRLEGVSANDLSGVSVAGAGDLNGDGLDDLIVGASGADPSGSDSGAAYVVYGARPLAEVSRTGTLADQTLVGSDFADTLTGGNGDDSLVGAGGNDTLTGGKGRDDLRGGAAVDTLEGGKGDDELRGDSGADRLRGGAGRDNLIGGLGADTLDGGAGRDVFRWLAAAESALAGGQDEITGFLRGEDTLNLAAIDADGNAANGDSRFLFIGAAGFSGASRELRAFTVNATSTRVEADVNGDGAADFSVLLLGVIGLDATDFVL